MNLPAAGPVACNAFFPNICNPMCGALRIKVVRFLRYMESSAYEVNIMSQLVEVVYGTEIALVYRLTAQVAADKQ